VVRTSTAVVPALPVLEVRGLSKRFGALQVLDDVSLTVTAGEAVAIVGDNGAGKSTLAKCIARALRPDSGEILLGGRPVGAGRDDALAGGVGVVWQDLSLCDNLDSVANLFLGRERGRPLLAEAAMRSEARRLLDRVGIEIPDLSRPVASLSGGQRQAVAVTRALAGDPQVLILDEPTANLGHNETRAVLALVRELRARGTTVVLISHHLDQVFNLVDRILVLRQGRLVADVSPREVHPDDVVALQSGIEADSTARRQLRRLGSLVEQLSAVEPTASLPLVVSAMSAAIGQETLCVHLLDGSSGVPVLRRSAAVALPDALLAVNDRLPLGPTGGPVGVAAETASVVVSEDVRTDPAWLAFRPAAERAGILSSWAAPISGSTGVLGTISGYGDTVGRLRADQRDLIMLYASHAAASIERERTFAESRRRNRVLEAIRVVLEVLAGPQPVHAGLDAALEALCKVLDAEDAVVRIGRPPDHEPTGDEPTGAAAAVVTRGQAGRPGLEPAADRALTGSCPIRVQEAGLVLAVPFAAPSGPAALAVRWSDAVAGDESAEVLQDVARSMSLALERAELEAAAREAQALRRSQRLQRAFLSRLSHELRTPLTAIHGYADSLRQPDVRWSDEVQRRFLDTIAAESERMRRLVADLLDVSAIDAGIFRVHPDWCDLGLVLDASVACVAPDRDTAERVTVQVDPDLGPVWADHDRLEQVFVNLLENALRHTPPDTRVAVDARPAPGGHHVHIRVRDDGGTLTAERAAALFEPHVSAGSEGGTGLGLPIARGIAAAHGGDVSLEAPAGAGRGPTTFLVALPLGPGWAADA
jgi:signal transduction histidine kinase/ABC-type multidrug transport system ATPase subunit